MTHERVDEQGTAGGRADDYSYDLAHEALVQGRDPEQAGAGAPGGGRESATYVATQTPDTGGDYGYDMAHQLPPPGGG